MFAKKKTGNFLCSCSVTQKTWRTDDRSCSETERYFLFISLKMISLMNVIRKFRPSTALVLRLGISTRGRVKIKRTFSSSRCPCSVTQISVTPVYNFSKFRKPVIWQFLVFPTLLKHSSLPANLFENN